MKQEQFKVNDSIGLSLIKGDGGIDNRHKEQLAFSINLTATLYDADGNMKEERAVKNTVTTAGLAGIMDQLLASPSLGKATHMGVGTGTPGGSALGTEIGTRQAFSSKTRDAAVVTHVASFGAGVATGALTEAGIFDASSSGNMWMSASFSTINKGANDTLQITWTLTGS
jgi:hypothetical protein